MEDFLGSFLQYCWGKWRIFGGSVLQYKLMRENGIFFFFFFFFWGGVCIAVHTVGKIGGFWGSARTSGALENFSERERRSKN